jgi:hypothetical protein
MSTLGMARCTVCQDPRRVQIEQALARGAGKRDAAAQFKPLHCDAIWRHWRNHVSDQQKAQLKVDFYRPGVEIVELAEKEGSGLLTRLEVLRGKLLWHLESASAADDRKSVAALSGQLLKLEELVAKASGDLVRHAPKKTVQHLHLSPQWQIFQGRVLGILRRFPDAYDAVVTAFRESEAVERAELPAPITIEGSVDGSDRAAIPSGG